MDLLWDALSWGFLLSGSALILIGSAGLLRLPDFYTRLHAGGVIDTMGAELMLIGMMFQAGFSIVTVKLFLIAVFLFFTSPTSTHAVANAAYVAGLRPFMSIDEAETGKEEEPSDS
jgi:multicomponent Na+:H+ antiporter subunit G